MGDNDQRDGHGTQAVQGVDVLPGWFRGDARFAHAGQLYTEVALTPFRVLA
jgi:hypothetical protein